MEIEVNKIYRTREGNTVLVTKELRAPQAFKWSYDVILIQDNDDYILGDGWHSTPEGNFWEDSASSCKEDLVELIGDRSTHPEYFL